MKRRIGGLEEEAKCLLTLVLGPGPNMGPEVSVYFKVGRSPNLLDLWLAAQEAVRSVGWTHKNWPTLSCPLSLFLSGGCWEIYDHRHIIIRLVRIISPGNVVVS